MDDLLGEFVAETLELLESLSRDVVAWESDPTDRQLLDSFFRFFHTVKGSCGFLNLSRLEKLAHGAEDVLAAFRAGERVPDDASISAVLAIMDQIGALAKALGDGEEGPPPQTDAALLAALVARPADHPGESDTTPDDGADAAPLAPDHAAPPSSPTTSDRAAAKRAGGPRTVRISLDLIDHLMIGVSDMVLARNELSRKLREGEVDPDIEASFERLSACVAEMRDMVSKTRMQRVDRLFAAIPRLVRDLSHDLGKSVELVLEGGDVEMDREMIEMVLDPLTHIVRNALDHGIEIPVDRRAAGKPESGRLLVSARQAGNQIVIEITDDGRGINGEALVTKALRQQIVTEAEVEGYSQHDRMNLIFHPGLSTAREVSAISGRGVGMDVVRTNVERLGGNVQLDSAPGRGTTITLRVPMTLTIIPGLILRAAGIGFAMARANVIELLHERGAIISMDFIAGAPIATIRGRRYPLVDLATLLRGEACAESAPARANRTVMLVRASGVPPYALIVDEVTNHEELVIRPAPPLIIGSEIYAGMTLPDNGRPMLLLDPSGIANVAQLPAEAWREESEQPSATGKTKTAGKVRAIQFLEPTGEQRVIPVDLVERIEDVPTSAIGISGGDHFVRLRGELIRLANPAAASGETTKVLKLRVGTQSLCYAVADVLDLIDIPVRPNLVRNKGIIAGIVMQGGLHLELIDGHALFAAHDLRDASATGRGICLIDGLVDDPWMRTILAPMLAQAGYDVRDAADCPDVPEGLCVRLTGADNSDGNGIPTIRLRASQQDDEADGADPSCYRYDRESLLAAIADIMRREAA